MNPTRTFIARSSFFLLTLSAFAQVILTVEYKGDPYEIVGVKGSKPIIDVDGKRRVRPLSKLKVAKSSGAPFQDANFVIRNKRIGRSRNRISGVDYYAVTLKAELKASTSRTAT